MDLDELQTVKDAERGKDSLQHLSDSFYTDVADHIAELKDQREECAARAEDPFSDPDVQRLTSEIDSTEQVVESIYERRVGKLVKLASFAAADMPADEEGLTSEERDLFSDLVSRIKENRMHVLDVLAGEADGSETGGGRGEASPDTDPAAESDGSVDPIDEEPRTPPSDESSVSAADLMGDGTDAEIPSSAGAVADPGEPAKGTSDHEASAEQSDSDTSETDPSSGADSTDDIERTTLRITRDVGEIVGVDDREYDLASQDVVTLPEANAGALVEREAAERLD